MEQDAVIAQRLNHLRLKRRSVMACQNGCKAGGKRLIGKSGKTCTYAIYCTKCGEAIDIWEEEC